MSRAFSFEEGVLGCRMRSQTPFSFVLRPADVLLLFSDGVPGRFKSSEYPSLTLDPAPTIASNIVRRFGKGIDDASCAVMRCRW
jgi:hypothetical protein